MTQRRRRIQPRHRPRQQDDRMSSGAAASTSRTSSSTSRKRIKAQTSRQQVPQTDQTEIPRHGIKRPGRETGQTPSIRSLQTE